jgi:hypothetical protein
MDAEGRATHGTVAEALKWTHSKLRNQFSNAVYRQKLTDRNPHPCPREVYILHPKKESRVREITNIGIMWL